MAKLLKLRRGTDTQHASFTTGEIGEITVNTTNNSIHVHDGGTTTGGTELARADLSNAAGASIPGTLTVNQLVVDDDGSGSPTLRVSGDDNSPWGLVVNNNTYTSNVNLGFRALQQNDGSFLMDYSGDGSYETILIRSGNGTTEENCISIDSNRAVNLHHANSTRLTTSSSGINVTGRVTCDGLTSDGSIDLESSTGVVNLKDTNNTGGAAQCEINFKDSNNSTLGFLGYANTSDDDFYISNSQSGSIQFNTNGQPRFEINNSGHVLPNTNNALDLGSSTQMWRHGWFDGTVNCDGLTSEGTITISSGDGRLDLKDNNSTGGATQNYVRGLDSNNAQKWYVGQAGSSNNNLYLLNEDSASIVFGTSGVARSFIDANGHLLPNTNNTYDLGGTNERWRNVYTNDLNLSNEGGANDVDGTWGNWTIQEGEDDLFLLNRRNGKKYKFNLSEVN